VRRFSFLPALLAALCLAGAARAAVPFTVLYNDADGVGFKDATPVGNTTLGAVRKAAFEEALSFWGHSLHGSNPVLVKANWVHAGSDGALAASGVGIQWADFPYAPKPGVAYVPALVSQFYGGYYSYNEQFPDILVQFNLDYSWYYGTDGNAPATQFDFFHAALHEICHGLGFQSNIEPDGTFLGQHGETTAPDSFSVNITSNGTLLTAMTPVQRKAAAVNGPLTFSGPATLAATDGHGATLAVTPGNFTIGTTANHLDQSYASTFDNLMVPGQPPGPIYSGESPIIFAMMKDLGWADVKQPLVSTESPLVGVPAYNKVTLRADVDPNGQATTVRFLVLTNGGNPHIYAADTLPADNDSHSVTLVAPFDMNVNDRYSVQALADYHHGYAEGERSFDFVPLTANAGAMLTFTGAKAMTASGMQILAGTTAFTVEGWINLSSLPSSDTEVLRLGDAGQPHLSWTAHPNGTLSASLAGGTSISVTQPLLANQWYQIATVFDGTTLTLYEQAGPQESTPAGSHPPMDALQIGGANPGSFAFSMDEVRVWNIARAQPELYTDFDRVGLSAGAGLVAAYRMDEATDIFAGTPVAFRGGYLTDGDMWAPSTATIGYPVPNATYATNVTRTAATLNGVVDPMGLDTTVQMGWGDFVRDNTEPAVPAAIPGGAPSTPVSANVTGLTPGRRYNFGPIATNAGTDSIVSGGVNQASGYFVTPAGPAGTALSFAGTGDAARVPNFGQKSFPNGITIQFWQNVAEARQQSTIVLNPDNVADRINVHTPWEDGIVYFDFGSILGAGRLAYAPPVNIVGTWQQFTFEAEPPDGSVGFPGAMQIYRNGVLEASKVGAGTYTPQTADLSIGGLPAGSYKGLLDEVRIWDRPLSDAEVKANWNTTLRGDEPGLVAYYPMDDASGSRAADATGNGNDAAFWSNGANGGQQRFNPFYWQDPAWAVSDAPAGGTPGLPDVVRILQIAGGLRAATPQDVLRYSADGTSVTLADALSAARAAAP
jgi:hypothetical protein